MSVKFKDSENDDVFLSYKNDGNRADGNHVLIIPVFQGQLLFTNHKLRGIEFPGGKKEVGESSEVAAARELFEETGATIKRCSYIAQYRVERQSGLSFTKDVFMVVVKDAKQQNDYLETNGPLFYNNVSDIPEERKSYLLKDAAILQCLERVMELGFYS
ncbi:RNA deprotection pyrophosphohydrolase [Staphylococcus sp. NAM3COL9]|uniref:RNA deprotection pyrophosphohydrolase n=1 Tax=Staphylococcus sp. NAM3COL9 TaxID=1667172 RepID=UPI00070BD670|nr:nucleoside triphosphatase YtkD [Staphylococcus sp. NAM3COL9]KRG10488.1 nucleoside triphosphatase [Staphylococcus sp. NAM3COL9]